MNLTIRSRHCVHLSWLSLLCASTFPTTHFTGSQCTSFCGLSSCFCCGGDGGDGGDGGGGDGGDGGDGGGGDGGDGGDGGGDGGDVVLKTIFINISCITKLYNKVVQQSCTTKLYNKAVTCL